jgi:hypothetical protein
MPEPQYTFVVDRSKSDGQISPGRCRFATLWHSGCLVDENENWRNPCALGRPWCRYHRPARQLAGRENSQSEGRSDSSTNLFAFSYGAIASDGKKPEYHNAAMMSYRASASRYVFGD